jgi:hypothetical protein
VGGILGITHRNLNFDAFLKGHKKSPDCSRLKLEIGLLVRLEHAGKSGGHGLTSGLIRRHRINRRGGYALVAESLFNDG